MTLIQRIFLVLVMCHASSLFAQTVLPAHQSHGRAARVPFVGCASYLGGRYQEGSTSEAAARLEEVTVDPKTVVQDKTTVPESVGRPKPAADLTAGTWKYKETLGLQDGTSLSTFFSTTIKDDGGVWTVTTAWESPQGSVTEVSTLEKGTLILRKESLKHFAKPGRPWVPVAINLDFTGNKVAGTIKRSGPDEPFALDLGGPVFGGNDGSGVAIGCLPLADGYSTTFRNFDIQSQEETLVHLKVVGMERVTVPAGTFDSYKVELTSANGRRSYKGTVWIAKDSRTPVRGSGSESVGRGTVSITTELVPNSVGVPRPAVDLTVGTWKYKETFVAPIGGTDHSTYSITIKDDGGVWTVTTAMEFSEGPVTDVSTLEKGTLILRKESFEHFAHPGQPWKPVAIKLDFNGNEVTGTMKYVSGQDKQVAVDLGGPLFAGPDVTIGSLPLADGYSTTFRYFDIDRFALNPQASNKVKLVQIRVVGMERVTVPAGTFDSYRVELTSADGGSNKAIIWIAKDSRMLVRASAVDELYGAITTEMVP